MERHHAHGVRPSGCGQGELYRAGAVAAAHARLAAPIGTVAPTLATKAPTLAVEVSFLSDVDAHYRFCYSCMARCFCIRLDRLVDVADEGPHLRVWRLSGARRQERVLR